MRAFSRPRVFLAFVLVIALTAVAWAAQTFAIQHTPAANTQATIAQAAAGGHRRNIARSITVTFSNNASGAAAVGTVFNLRDGATGAGTILWSGTIWLPATPGASESIALSDLDIVGSENTAMTLEAAAGGGANTVQSVALTGEVR